MSFRRCVICLLAGLASSLWLSQALAAEVGLTFFGWSDQHVTTKGDGKHLEAAIDAMNALPGTEYPAAVGGKVAAPAFVFGCGDITDWPSTAAKNTYHELITKRLKFPAYDVAGNHDEGGDSPVDTMKKWLTARHGALSYTFEKGGVHFIIVFSMFDETLKNPAQPLTKEALGFVREQIAKVPDGAPVIVATHLCLESMTNRDEFVDALGKANVLMVLSGHYHKGKVQQHRGVTFVQLPSPAPNGEREFTVVRITSDRLNIVPWNYEKKQWVDSERKVLDTRVRGPQPATRAVSFRCPHWDRRGFSPG